MAKKHEVASKMKDPRKEAASHIGKIAKAAGKAAKVVKLNDKGLPF